MAAARKVVRLSLADFYKYLQTTGRELNACYQKLEQTQQAIREIFDQVLSEWQETFGACYPVILAQRAEMPPDFAHLIDVTETEEVARLCGEIADLSGQVTAGRQQMDELTAQAQETTAALKKSNPGLDAREERLKLRVAQFQDEYTQAYEEAEALDAPAFGWLSNAGKIRRLRKVMRLAKKQQTEALKDLREVRQDWLTRVEQTGETQSELRAKWQEMSIETSEIQGRHDYLRAHLEQLAEEAAVRRVLEELLEDTDVSGELGQNLSKLAAQNKVRLAYEQGVGSAAEAVGLTKGVGTGLTRFAKSVKSVLAEQKRHSLPRVKVEVSPGVQSINDTWRYLTPRLDIKRYANEPVEFAELVDRIISRRLTPDNIERYFVDMGKALNRATSRWD